MIAKKTKIAGTALAAALPFSNVSVEAAGSAVTPLSGAYVIINKMECGGSSGFNSASSVGNMTFSPTHGTRIKLGAMPGACRTQPTRRHTVRSDSIAGQRSRKRPSNGAG